MGGAAGTGVTLCAPGVASSCYDGPAGTDKNSPCKAGLHVCELDGMSYGACNSQVLPGLENCATAVDEDCNGVPNDHCAVWSKCFGTSATQKARAMRVNAQGRMGVTGEMYGPINFGGGALPLMGGGDVFVASFDAAGQHLWSKAFGDLSSGGTWQSGLAIALDGLGNTIVGGSSYGTMTFGSTILTSAGEGDMFVARLGVDGQPLWAKRFGGTLYDEVTALAADSTGNVFAGGGFCGPTDFGSGTKTPLSCDGIVIALAPGGTTQWSFTFGMAGDDWADGIALDPSGNVLITGVIGQSATFGNTVLTGKGQADVMVAKFNASGTASWAKSFGSAAIDRGDAVASDPSGNVVVAGFFGGGIDFGCGLMPASGDTALFVVKLSPSGQCLWSKGYGSQESGSQRAAVATDASGNVFVTLSFTGSSDFDGQVVSSTGEHDVVVLSLDPTGKRRFVRKFGGSGDQDGRSIGVDASGNIYLLAEVGGTVDFGNGKLTMSSSDDVCVARLSP
jgi:hypothetical protein